VAGIPPIIPPLNGLRKPKKLAVGGNLLMASGILSVFAFWGIFISIDYLTILSIIGGILFFLSLFTIIIHFICIHKN
jgi:hypothetical protein